MYIYNTLESRLNQGILYGSSGADKPGLLSGAVPKAMEQYFDRACSEPNILTLAASGTYRSPTRYNVDNIQHATETLTVKQKVFRTPMIMTIW
jgi:hypothetical protein